MSVDATRVRGHKEWAKPPGRKTDPRYDMAWRRARVVALAAQTSPSPSPPPRPPMGTDSEEHDMTMLVVRLTTGPAVLLLFYPSGTVSVPIKNGTQLKSLTESGVPFFDAADQDIWSRLHQARMPG